MPQALLTIMQVPLEEEVFLQVQVEMPLPQALHQTQAL